MISHSSPKIKSVEDSSNELNAHPEQYTYLTVEAIIAHVYEQYDASYSVSGMTDLLHRLKFTYKKSKLVPAKADKKKQEEFLKQLDTLKASKGKDEPILYMDGVHPQHNTILSFKIVSHFLETSKIQWVFLPSYSPNLNLIERLWTFMKKKVLYNKYYETFDTFKEVT